jgi:hypothetical protein
LFGRAAILIAYLFTSVLAADAAVGRQVILSSPSEPPILAQILTYTVVPKDSGYRLGVDQDRDGYGDRTEVLAGSNPEDPLDTP